MKVLKLEMKEIAISFLMFYHQDYHKIFMDGGVKTVNDPDQEIFLK